MSRPIKFRAWDGKDLFIPQRMLWSSDDEIFLVDAEGVNRGSRCTLMQFTGLTDKNGKEIYEGDIVRGRFEGYNPGLDVDELFEEMCGVVRWDYAGWVFDVVQHLSDPNRLGMVNYFGFQDHQRYDSHFRYMEVIGDIYRNPELLKPEAV